MHAGGGTNDRGEKRNVLIVSILLLIGSDLELTLRSDTQRRIPARERVSFINENTPRAPTGTKNTRKPARLAILR